jgi:hypothetical protein
MSEAVLKKEFHYFFSIAILGIFLISLILLSGCLGKEKISETDAANIAVNDSQTLYLIGNNEFRVASVGLGSFSSGSGTPEEMYLVTIEKQNSTGVHINVFVNFEGKVVHVDTSYTATAPDYLINRTYAVESTKNGSNP